jgi:hypothetical protein
MCLPRGDAGMGILLEVSSLLSSFLFLNLNRLSWLWPNFSAFSYLLRSYTGWRFCGGYYFQQQKSFGLAHIERGFGGYVDITIRSRSNYEMIAMFLVMRIEFGSIHLNIRFENRHLLHLLV